MTLLSKHLEDVLDTFLNAIESFLILGIFSLDQQFDMQADASIKSSSGQVGAVPRTQCKTKKETPGQNLGVGEVGGCLRRKILPFFRGGTSKTTVF